MITVMKICHLEVLFRKEEICERPGLTHAVSGQIQRRHVSRLNLMSEHMSRRPPASTRAKQESQLINWHEVIVLVDKLVVLL